MWRDAWIARYVNKPMTILRPLPVYRVRATNTAPESENRIHDDRVAAEYGFRGGLVPGVTVYGYMTVPVVTRLGRAWLERGSMAVRFQEPFYEGDEVIVRSRTDDTAIHVRAERPDGTTAGTVCATGVATIEYHAAPQALPVGDLPPMEERPHATRDSLGPGVVLGTLVEKLDLSDSSFLDRIEDSQPLYRGPDAVAHPAVLLGLANQIFIRNFRLGPWIHAASELTNWSVARHGEQLAVRGRIEDRFERKGHEFVVLNVAVIANESRLVQSVRHTAIYRPRPR